MSGVFYSFPWTTGVSIHICERVKLYNIYVIVKKVKKCERLRQEEECGSLILK